MNGEKELTRRTIRSKSCPEIPLRFKYKKKPKLNKEDEIWKSFSFLVRRLDDGEKQQRNLIYHATQTRFSILSVYNSLNEVSEKVMEMQDCILQLQGSIKLLQEEKSKKFEKLIKKKKMKDDSNDLSSLVNSLPFPDEPLTKKKPNDDNFPT